MSTLPPVPEPSLPTPAVTSSSTLTFGGYSGAPGALQGETFLRRAIAKIIDMVPHFGASYAGGFLFSTIVLAASAGHLPRQWIINLRQPAISPFVFALLGSLLMEAIQEGVHGSTLGKVCLGMVVVQEDGTPCRFGPALIRSAAYFIDSFFFGLIAYFQMEKTPQEQRYGDQWAHTVVCNRRDAPAESLRGPGRFVVGFVLACMADAAMAMTGLLFKMLV